MEKQFNKPAVWNGEYYHHVGIHPSVISLYGNKVEDIVTVTFKISDDQTPPTGSLKDSGEKNVDYWGWYDAEDDEFSNMIYANKFLLEMCFPSGTKICEERGQGKAFRLEVVTKK